jgi:hypothetical protein
VPLQESTPTGTLGILGAVSLPTHAALVRVGAYVRRSIWRNFRINLAGKFVRVIIMILLSYVCHVALQIWTTLGFEQSQSN